MATKLRTQSGGASATLGGLGPFIGSWVAITNMSSDETVYVGGDDEECNYPVHPGKTVYFPIGDSEYLYFITKNGAGGITTVPFVVAGLMSV